MMRYIVHCPFGTEEKIQKKMVEARMFSNTDKVVYIESACVVPYVETLLD